MKKSFFERMGGSYHPEGVTEQLKADEQIEWVSRMNNIKSRVEEIVCNELINN